jgi:Glycosyltransferase family 87
MGMSVHGPLGAASESGNFGLTGRTLDSSRATSNSRLGLVGLAGVLVAGSVIAISASQTDSLLPESVRPVPSSLAGAFGTGGPNLHVAGAIAAFALMLVSYAIAVRAADRLSGRAVLMSIAALHALILLAPPLLSTDIFSYQAYARIGAVYGANPYLDGPHAIALDPLFPYIGAKWSYIPSAYGPVFTTFSYLLAPLSIAASVLAYKSVAAVASLAIVALVWNSARLRGLNPVKAAALVGLNPLLVVYGVGGGHNDMLMLLALVAGVYVMLNHRERLGGGLMVLAVGIKLTAGLVLPFAIAAGGSQRGRDRRRDVVIGAGVGAALVAALGFALFGAGPLHLLATVHKTQSEGDWHSIPGFISTRLGLSPVGHVAGYVLTVILAGVCCWLLRRVWRGELDWIDAAGWATAAMLVTASSLLPWYVAWLLPLAALATDRRLFTTAIVMTAVVQCIQLLGYIPHGSSLFGL